MNEQQDIAQQVNNRAAELLPDEQIEPLEERFVKECLDANERGDGCMFATMHKDRFLYNTTPKDGEWYSWAGHVWEADDFSRAEDAVEQCALEYLRISQRLEKEVQEQGINAKHPDRWKIALAEKFRKRADRLRGKGGVEKALWWSKIVDKAMACRESDFNKNPWLLPVKNGVVDLTTGALTAGRPADLMTRALDCDYDYEADYTLWHDTVVEICGSEEVAQFLKRSFGYAISGFSYEQYIWVFIGPGRNGKGILFSLLSDVLGPFYHEITRGMILEQRNEPPPNAASEHKYSLLGKRLIVGAETNQGQKIDAAAVKSLTGEDKVTCRPNFGREISFSPTHTLFLHTNHIPHGLTKDFAMVQRLLLIEFPHMYVDDVEAESKKNPTQKSRFRKKDPKLKEKLLKHRTAILRWLVEGCLEWREHGLSPPKTVTDSVNELARSEDYIGQFITDCLDHWPDRPVEEIKLPTTAMYDAFLWWRSHNMDTREDRCPAMKTINKHLRDRGYIIEKQGGKFHIFQVSIKLDITQDVQNYAYSHNKS